MQQQQQELLAWQALKSQLHRVVCCSGDKLSIALVENATAAAELLAWHAKHSHSSKPLRVWDLQRLHSYDKLQQHRHAQASFAPGTCNLSEFTGLKTILARGIPKPALHQVLAFLQVLIGCWAKPS